MAGNIAPPSRFQRAKFFPAHTSEAATTFLSLFHRHSYIYRSMDGGGWLSAKDDWSLTDTEILKAIACAHPKYFLGTRSGRASRYAVLDIDAGSKYHSKSGYEEIAALLERAGIFEHNLYRSSHSGGWHLYIFFDAPVSSKDLYRQFHQLFSQSGFAVAKGQLEIFPNPGEKSLGQGLRIPLQPGFAWLAHHSLVVRDDREEMSPAQALLQFVKDMECSANPYHSFHQLKAFVETSQAKKPKNDQKTIAPISKSGGEVVQMRPTLAQVNSEAAREVEVVFGKLPPGINCDTWLKGRSYYENGLSGPGQRAEAVFSLSHYLFYGDPKNQLRAFGYGQEEGRRQIIDELIQAKHFGQSKDISAGRQDALKQIERAVAWVPPHRRGLVQEKYEPVVPISWVRNNANRAMKAQRLITAAVDDFLEVGMPFSSRDLALKCGVSSRTLAKYPELWKPAMEAMRTGRLKTALHEYNAVESTSMAVGSDSADSILSVPVLDQSPIDSDFDLFESSNLFDRAAEIPLFFLEASPRASSAGEKAWLARVSDLLRKSRSALFEGWGHRLLKRLSRELIVSPSEEHASWLRFRLSLLRNCLVAQGDPVQLTLLPYETAS